MSERKTNLIAEPGDRVEVNCTAKHGWEPGMVRAVDTTWYLGIDGTQAHVNWYRVDIDRGPYKHLRADQIRKPEQPRSTR